MFNIGLTYVQYMFNIFYSKNMLIICLNFICVEGKDIKKVDNFTYLVCILWNHLIRWDQFSWILTFFRGDVISWMLDYCFSYKNNSFFNCSRSLL